MPKTAGKSFRKLRNAAPLGLAALFATGLAAQSQAATVKTLYNFDASKGLGTSPQTGLVPGPETALYGATQSSIFKAKPDPKGNYVVTLVYQAGGVRAIASSSTALYLAVPNGGSAGVGYIVELTPPGKGETAWKANTIYTFLGGNDGARPIGLTVSGTKLFGQTDAGGGSSACGSDNGVPTGCGTVFELTRTKSGWTETIVHVWAGAGKGVLPFTAPSFDAAGNMYVSTQQGGGHAGATVPPGGRAACSGGGVQAELPKSGAHFGALLQLYKENCQSAKDPQYPNDVILPVTLSPAAKVIGAANAALITSSGGGNSTLCTADDDGGCGTVGILTAGTNPKAAWVYRTLHNFSFTDGALPAGYLLADSTGSTIYGTTGFGGVVSTSCNSNGCGTIYSLTLKASSWVWNGVPYRFKGKTDGAVPTDQLTLVNGVILGTTSAGGSHGGGTIFELEP